MHHQGISLRPLEGSAPPAAHKPSLLRPPSPSEPQHTLPAGLDSQASARAPHLLTRGAEDRADDQRAHTAQVSTRRAFHAGPALCSHLHTRASSPAQEPGQEHRGSLLTSYRAPGGAGVWWAWSKVHNPVTSRSQAPRRRSLQHQELKMPMASPIPHKPDR